MHKTQSETAKACSIGSPVWTTPVICPMPEEVNGVNQVSIDLNDRSGGGIWEFIMRTIPGIPLPTEQNQDFDLESLPKEGWRAVAVPCELAMQGFDIDNNTEYYYRRAMRIPEDFAGKRIVLRFDGVYSNARCWVNGHFIRSHVGGFTSWDCDITDVVVPGETAMLIVGVADLEGSAVGTWNPDGKIMGDPSWASYYAHHNIGGILRDVTLFATAKTYLARFYTEVHFDQDFVDADLDITAQAMKNQGAAVLHMELLDDGGTHVKSAVMELEQEEPKKISLAVDAPVHWDAEHPVLYTLRTKLEIGGRVEQVNTQKVGFRELRYGGQNGTDANKIYVNGKEVKLRGTCRHDVSLIGGRSTTKEEDWEEIKAYRNANINHIRTSHYPASRHLLDACDALGMYVEQENGVCFQGANGYDVHAPAADFVRPFTEMIERDRNRACIILWSLGNESGFEKTPAFRIEYDYVKSVDQSRPVIFSYPFTLETLPHPYDVYSRHYEDFDGVLGGMDMPVLHDEFAHISCYNLDDLKRDPNVRNFWGASLKKAWERIFETDGALGADLWGGIDDVFLLPENVSERWQNHSAGRAAGYGQWGSVLDVYRRLKPEAYLTKKAYSPIRVEEKSACIVGDSLMIPVKNWFDHTDLSEIKLECCTDGGEKYEVELPCTAPHHDGWICLKGEWDSVHTVGLEFWHGDRIVDEYCLSLHSQKTVKEGPAGPVPILEETEQEILVSTADYQIRFDKKKACLIEADFRGRPMLTGGPYLNRNGIPLQGWKSDRAAYAALENNRAVVILQGYYGNSQRVHFIFRISGNGLITVEYQLHRYTADAQNVTELGIAFDIPKDAARVEWRRDSLYSVYPADHIGRSSGYAEKCNSKAIEAGYGGYPNWSWKDDMHDTYLFAPGDPMTGLATNDFKALKENIREYKVGFASNSAQICVEANGDAAARVQFERNASGEENAKLIVNQQWYYPGLAWGNDTGHPVRLGIGVLGSVALWLNKAGN